MLELAMFHEDDGDDDDDDDEEEVCLPHIREVLVSEAKARQRTVMALEEGRLLMMPPESGWEGQSSLPVGDGNVSEGVSATAAVEDDGRRARQLQLQQQQQQQQEEQERMVLQQQQQRLEAEEMRQREETGMMETAAAVSGGASAEQTQREPSVARPDIQAKAAASGAESCDEDAAVIQTSTAQDAAEKYPAMPVSKQHLIKASSSPSRSSPLRATAGGSGEQAVQAWPSPIPPAAPAAASAKKEGWPGSGASPMTPAARHPAPWPAPPRAIDSGKDAMHAWTPTEQSQAGESLGEVGGQRKRAGEVWGTAGRGARPWPAGDFAGNAASVQVEGQIALLNSTILSERSAREALERKIEVLSTSVNESVLNSSIREALESRIDALSASLNESIFNNSNSMAIASTSSVLDTTHASAAAAAAAAAAKDRAMAAASRLARSLALSRLLSRSSARYLSPWSRKAAASTARNRVVMSWCCSRRAAESMDGPRIVLWAWHAAAALLAGERREKELAGRIESLQAIAREGEHTMLAEIATGDDAPDEANNAAEKPAVEIKESFLKEIDAVVERGDPEEMELSLNECVALLRRLGSTAARLSTPRLGSPKKASNPKSDAAMASALEDALWKADSAASKLSSLNKALARRLDADASKVKDAINAEQAARSVLKSHEEVSAAKASLQASFDKLKVELDGVRDSEEALREEVKEKDSSISALNREVKALKDKMEKFNGREKELKDELEKEKAKSSDLGNKVSTLSEEHSMEIEKLKANLSTEVETGLAREIDAGIAEMRADLEAALKRCAESESNAAKALSDLEAATKRAAEAESEAGKVKEELVVARREGDTALAELTAVENEARELRKEGERLKQMLTKSDVMRVEAEKEVEEFDHIAKEMVTEGEHGLLDARRRLEEYEKLLSEKDASLSIAESEVKRLRNSLKLAVADLEASALEHEADLAKAGVAIKLCQAAALKAAGQGDEDKEARILMLVRERREEEGRKLGVQDLWASNGDDAAIFSPLPALGGGTTGGGLPHEVGGPSGGETAKLEGGKGPSGTPPPQGGGGACAECSKWESEVQQAIRELEAERSRNRKSIEKESENSGANESAAVVAELQQLAYERAEEAKQLRAQNKKLTAQLERKLGKARGFEEELAREREEGVSLREELVGLKCESTGLRDEVDFLKSALEQMEAGGGVKSGGGKKAKAELKSVKEELERALSELGEVKAQTVSIKAELSEAVMTLTAEIGLSRLEAREILDQFSLLEPGVSHDADDSVMVDLRGELEVMMHELNEERRRSSDLATKAKTKQKKLEEKLEAEKKKRAEMEDELDQIREQVMEAAGLDDETTGDAGRELALKISLKEEKRKKHELEERLSEMEEELKKQAAAVGDARSLEKEVERLKMDHEQYVADQEMIREEEKQNMLMITDMLNSSPPKETKKKKKKKKGLFGTIEAEDEDASDTAAKGSATAPGIKSMFGMGGRGGSQDKDDTEEVGASPPLNDDVKKGPGKKKTFFSLGGGSAPAEKATPDQGEDPKSGRGEGGAGEEGSEAGDEESSKVDAKTSTWSSLVARKPGSTSQDTPSRSTSSDGAKPGGFFGFRRGAHESAAADGDEVVAQGKGAKRGLFGTGGSKDEKVVSSDAPASPPKSRFGGMGGSAVERRPSTEAPQKRSLFGLGGSAVERRPSTEAPNRKPMFGFGASAADKASLEAPTSVEAKVATAAAEAGGAKKGLFGMGRKK